MPTEQTNPVLSQDFLETVIRQTSDVVLLLDPVGIIGHTFGAEHLGYSDSDLIGWSVFDLLLSEDRPRARAELNKIAGGTPIDPVVIRGIHADRSVRWYEVPAATYVSEAGATGSSP